MEETEGRGRRERVKYEAIMRGGFMDGEREGGRREKGEGGRRGQWDRKENEGTYKVREKDEGVEDKRGDS